MLPDARLRELFTGLVEARELGRQLSLSSGEEACWVAPALALTPGDLVSVPDGTGADSLLSYLRRKEQPAGKALAGALVGNVASWCLPAIPSGRNRVWAALGAAAALRATERVVLCYVDMNELRASEWKILLGMVGKLPLPLVIIALPSGSQVATLEKCGMPIIPVEAQDAIAVYRVAQECIGRARAGGGAAVLACVALGTEDSVAMLARQLVERQVLTESWINSTKSKIELRLHAALHRRT